MGSAIKPFNGGETAGRIPDIVGLRAPSVQENAYVPDGAEDNPAHEFWYTDPSTGYSVSTAVTPERAMTVSAVMGCTKVLSEAAAMLPLKLYYRLKNGGKELARREPLYDVLGQSPSPTATSLEWREMMMVHMLLRGPAYSEVTRNGGGDVVMLESLHPDLVDVKKTPDRRFQYKVRDENNIANTVTLGHNDILYVRGMSTDGVNALNPIAYARKTVGLALELETHGQAVFQNGARPAGLVIHPGELSEEAKERIRVKWMARFSGSNAGGVAVLSEDMKYENVSMTSEDAQWLESRRYSVEEIARIYRVPLSFLQDDTHATFSNITQKSLDFVIHTLTPWLKRIESKINAHLIEDPDLFCEHNVDGLLRGDPETRSNALAIQFRNGAITQDEWRSLENRNPLPEGRGTRHYVPKELQSVEHMEQSADIEARKANLEIDQLVEEADQRLADAQAAIEAGANTEDAAAAADKQAKMELLQFKRDVLKKFLEDGTTNDVVYNITWIRKLLEELDIPTDPTSKDYLEPWLPVRDDSGALVSGETIEDSSGDVVGGDVIDDGGDGDNDSDEVTKRRSDGGKDNGENGDGGDDDNNSDGDDGGSVGDGDVSESAKNQSWIPACAGMTAGGMEAVLSPLIEDVADRMARSECRTLERRLEHRNADPARFADWAAGFYEKRRAYVANILAPLGRTVAACGGHLDAEGIVDLLTGENHVAAVVADGYVADVEMMRAAMVGVIEEGVRTPDQSGLKTLPDGDSGTTTDED